MMKKQIIILGIVIAFLIMALSMLMIMSPSYRAPPPNLGPGNVEWLPYVHKSPLWLQGPSALLGYVIYTIT